MKRGSNDNEDKIFPQIPHVTRAHHPPLSHFSSLPSTLSPHPTATNDPQPCFYTCPSSIYPLFHHSTHFISLYLQEFLHTISHFTKMMLRAAVAVGGGNPLFGTSPSSPASSNQKIPSSNLCGLWGKKMVVAALQERESGGSLTGVVFQPFEEIKSDEFMVPMDPKVSLAAQRYAQECEAAINEQINVEYSASYVYHSLYAYFDRDNVALKGFAKFFRESSEEEREHAEKFMQYQNMRGGRVKLNQICSPPSEFLHVEKGDALYAMELALGLEKLVNEKLLNLHSVAEKNNDPQLQEFIEGEFLNEQVETIKKIADYVTQLRMVGKGHGVWHFDQMLLN